MTSSDPAGPRAPLDRAVLRAALDGAGYPWPEPRLVAATGSTNADLALLADQGAAEGTVLAADLQTAGRGRLDRSWESPAGAGLTFSLVLRPSPALPVAAWGWLPLLVGTAVVVALRTQTGVPVALKWPNDVVVAGPDRAGGPGPRKLGGILAERLASGAAVVGVGLDVHQRAEELPVASATSLALEGAPADRGRLLAAVLVSVAARYAAWTAALGDPERSGLRADYLALCTTVGSAVRVAAPGAADLEAVAVGVDEAGRLLVRDAGGAVTAVAAGDVTLATGPTG